MPERVQLDRAAACSNDIRALNSIRAARKVGLSYRLGPWCRSEVNDEKHTICIDDRRRAFCDGWLIRYADTAQRRQRQQPQADTAAHGYGIAARDCRAQRSRRAPQGREEG